MFEAILMAAICKIGSRLVPGYRLLPLTQNAMLYVRQSPSPPWFLTKNCLRDSEKKEIILKYFDFFEYLFILHLLNGEKRCLPYLSEPESAINAGEFLFQVCFTTYTLYFAYDINTDTATCFDVCPV